MMPIKSALERSRSPKQQSLKTVKAKGSRKEQSKVEYIKQSTQIKRYVIQSPTPILQCTQSHQVQHTRKNIHVPYKHKHMHKHNTLTVPLPPISSRQKKKKTKNQKTKKLRQVLAARFHPISHCCSTRPDQGRYNSRRASRVEP